MLIRVTGGFFLWHEVSSCDRKFLPLTGSFFLWQEVSSCYRRFLSVTESFFLWHIVFRSREYSIFATKCGNSTKHFVWGIKNFCHLGCQVASKNPNLGSWRIRVLVDEGAGGWGCLWMRVLVDKGTSRWGCWRIRVLVDEGAGGLIRVMLKLCQYKKFGRRLWNVQEL